MREIANNVSAEALAVEDAVLEARIFHTMIVTVVIAVIAGVFLAPWRVTSGLMLGGGLSLLNYNWLRTSMAAVFRNENAGKQPRIRMSRYVIRYFVITAVFCRNRPEKPLSKLRNTPSRFRSSSSL